MYQQLSRKELKQQAKDILAQRWGSAILMTLIPNLIIFLIVLLITIPSMVLSIVNLAAVDLIAENQLPYLRSLTATGTEIGFYLLFLILMIFASLLQILIETSSNLTFLAALRGQKQGNYQITDAFFCFRRPYFLGITLITIFIGIFTYFWLLLLIIPAYVKVYSYSQSYFVYYDIYEGTKEKPGVLECITASRQLMKGYKWQLFVLDLSFIGWSILASITVIGWLWLLPYWKATRAAFYNALPSEVEY